LFHLDASNKLILRRLLEALVSSSSIGRNILRPQVPFVTWLHHARPLPARLGKITLYKRLLIYAGSCGDNHPHSISLLLVCIFGAFSVPSLGSCTLLSTRSHDDGSPPLTNGLVLLTLPGALCCDPPMGHLQHDGTEMLAMETMLPGGL
jgi:hypothetical protein